MASKGFQAVYVSSQIEFLTGCCVSHTTEPLIGYDRLAAGIFI